ncbi:MAG: endonuclease/exonuclease/phosphatase family protein [Bacteroidota bacterium]|nr:endonuclease/exonuclease/phosphatase family protein [Bacteroidota bacterium]
MFGKTIVKWVLMASNIVAALFMIMTLFGSVFSPAKFVIPAYFALAFPFIIAVNIAFAVFWLLARKWFFLVSLSVLLLSSTQISNTCPVHFRKTETPPTNNPIRLLTYNTKVCGELKKYTRRNPNKVIQYILDTDADIVCLQEFTVSSNKEYLTQADIFRIFKKYPYKHIQYKQNINNNWQLSGVATFSKYPITNRQLIHYPSNYNVSIFSDININGKIIRLVNNHLESNRLTEHDKNMPLTLKDNFDTKKLTGITLHFSHKLAVAYRLRALQADSVAKVIASSPYKVIVCGDFNDVPTSYAYTTVKGNLKDTFAETGLGLGWTFNDRYYHFRIDYVFYDPVAFTPIQYKADKVKYSDHYPILCKLNINNI